MIVFSFLARWSPSASLLEQSSSLSLCFFLNCKTMKSFSDPISCSKCAVPSTGRVARRLMEARGLLDSGMQRAAEISGNKKDGTNRRLYHVERHNPWMACHVSGFSAMRSTKSAHAHQENGTGRRRGGGASAGGGLKIDGGCPRVGLFE